MNPEQLLENHAQLQDAFQEVLEQARINQHIMQRHQAFDMRLLDADDFSDLLDILLNGMLVAFDLQMVNVFLHDSKHSVRHILAHLKAQPDHLGHLHFLDYTEQFGPEYTALAGPALSVYQPERHQCFFPDGPAPASIAILPLHRHQAAIGFLALGSTDETRFSAHLATDFVERQASFIAICIENVINKERLKQVGLTDPLTGVSNRRYIEQRMLAEINQAQRHQSELSLLYIDIDFFKRVNDTAGHQVGDEVLCEVANRIKGQLRINDALARFGGEEFVVLLMQTGHAAALQIAERIRLSIASEPITYKSATPLSGGALESTVSIGVSSIAPGARDATSTLMHQIIAQADKALYHAKKNGRNQVVSDTLLQK